MSVKRRFSTRWGHHYHHQGAYAKCRQTLPHPLCPIRPMFPESYMEWPAQRKREDPSDARIFAAPPLVAPARGARRGDLSLELMRRSTCVASEITCAHGRGVRMQVLHQICAGMDVHKKDVKVCLVTRDSEGQRQEEVRTFRTMTRDLLAMRAWLQGQGCTVIAIESTGVYWKPIFNLFEGDFTVMLVNPAHIKQVPGRK